jgi:hypothetical protein
MIESEGAFYYDRQGRPIRRELAMELFGRRSQERIVSKTKVGEAEVSTVHLVLDHGFGEGPPIIFETMIFGGPYDQWQDRYSTEAAAIAGHDQVVAALRQGRAPR